MTERAFTEESYTAYLGEHQLMGSQCPACGKSYLPPRPFCPDCHRDDMQWAAMPTTGTLKAFTSIHIGPKAMIEAGYGRKNPFCVGIVQLDDGPAISALILGLDPAHPESIKIGTPLQATFVERGEEGSQRSFLAFEVKDQ